MGSKALLQLLKFRIRYLSLTNQKVCLLGRLFSYEEIRLNYLKQASVC
jgi:hypothetical protein